MIPIQTPIHPLPRSLEAEPQPKPQLGMVPGLRIRPQMALTFDDVLLVPRYSGIV